MTTTTTTTATTRNPYCVARMTDEVHDTTGAGRLPIPARVAEVVSRHRTRLAARRALARLPRSLRELCDTVVCDAEAHKAQQ